LRATPPVQESPKAVSGGQIWIDNESLRALLEDTGAISRPGKISGVTDREKEIIECVCQGMSNREIARRLVLSEYTVKTHLNTIFKKFNISNRSKLMMLAMQSPLAGSVEHGEASRGRCLCMRSI
jgi:DNA-binding NarL/FixJ family response regulator